MGFTGSKQLAFGLGGGAAEAVTERPLGGGSQFRNPLIQYLSNAEIEALEENPDILKQIQMREDNEIIELIVTIITRGLL